MHIFNKITSELKTEINEVNKKIIDELQVEEKLITEVGQYLTNSGGKRIRPILTILTAKMLGEVNDDIISLASAVESLHMATLLHDDIIDNSMMRRANKSAHLIWGSNTSILVGDFLFSMAFKLMVNTSSLEALKSLSHASAIIVEGEVSQLAMMKNKEFITQEKYMQVVRSKTAELFASSCEVSAIILNKSSKIRNDIYQFAILLGKIFQIQDDVLDYFADDNNNFGKKIGDDFFENKITLPLIILKEIIDAHMNSNDKVNKIDQENQTLFNMIINNDKKTNSELKQIISLSKHYNIHEKIDNIVQNLTKEAENILTNIDDVEKNNKYQNLLLEILYFASKRNY